MTNGTFLALVLACGVAFGQSRNAGSSRPRIFIETSSAWQMNGGGGWNSDGGGGGFSGGSRPQTVEIMKTFQERCPVTITNRREAADYVVSFDRDGGKDLLRKDNKIAIFNKDGDLIHTSSTRSLGNAVKNACGVISGRP